MNLNLCLIPHNKLTKNIALNVRSKTVKLLEGHIGINLHELRLGKAFSGMTSKAQVTK